MNQDNGKKVYIRLCNKPAFGAQEIYRAMGYKTMPYHRKNLCFPKTENIIGIIMIIK